MRAFANNARTELEVLEVPPVHGKRRALSFTIQTQISPGTLIVSGDARVLILNLGNGEDGNEVTYVEKRSDGTIRQQPGSWDGLMHLLDSPEKRIIQTAKPRFYESELIPVESLDPSSRTFEWKQLVPGTVIERTDGTREEIIAIESEERSGGYLIQSIVSKEGEITLRDHQIVLDHQLTGDLFYDKIEAIWIPRTEQNSSPGLKPLQPHEVTLTQDSLNNLDQLALKTRRPVTIRLTGSSANWLNPNASDESDRLAAVLKDFDGVILVGDTAIYTDGLTPQRHFTAQDIPGLMEKSPATVIGVRIDGSWREGTYNVTSDGRAVELPIVSVHKGSNSPDEITVYGGASNHITAMVEPTDQAKKPSNWKWQGEVEAAVQAATHLEKNHLFQKPILLAIDGGQTVLEEIERYKTNGWPIVLYSPPESRANLTAVGKLVSELRNSGETNDLVFIAETPEQLREALEKFEALGECAWEQQLTSVLLTQPDSSGNTPEKGQSSPLLSSAHPILQEWFKYVDEKMAEAVQKLSGSLQEGSIAERRRFCQMIGDLREAGDAILRFLLRAELHLPEKANIHSINEASIITELAESRPDVSVDEALRFAKEFVSRASNRTDSRAGLQDTFYRLEKDFQSLFSQISQHFLDQPAPVRQMAKTVENCRIVARMMSELYLDTTDPRVPDTGLVASFKPPRYFAEATVITYSDQDGAIVGLAIYLDPQEAKSKFPALNLVPSQINSTGFIDYLYIDPRCNESGRAYSVLAGACELQAELSGASHIAWYVSASNIRAVRAHTSLGDATTLALATHDQVSAAGNDGRFLLMMKSLKHNEPSVINRHSIARHARELYLGTHPATQPENPSQWATLYSKLRERFKYCEEVCTVVKEMEVGEIEGRSRSTGELIVRLLQPQKEVFKAIVDQYQNGTVGWNKVLSEAKRLVNWQSVNRDREDLALFFNLQK